jgi:hypothetical protein
MMHIIDLEHLEVPDSVSEYHKASPADLIQGATSAFIAGYAYVGTNYAVANLIAGASGQQAFTYTNTSAVTSLYPYYSTSTATASGYAIGSSPDTYAMVSYDASANNTSFNGNSSSMSSGIISSTYRTW